MYNTDALTEKLKEIEALINEKTKQDSSSDFDIDRVFVSLEIARRILCEDSKKQDSIHEGKK